MHTITLLSQVSRQTVSDMAKGAADRGEPLDVANVFEHGSDHHRAFRIDYLKRQNALELVN